MILNPLKYNCPFCAKDLPSRLTKCFNIYCQGQTFNVGNLVNYRLNPDLGLGRIIRNIEIPVSRSLDEEDSKSIITHKVLFRDNVIKIIPPIDLLHYIFELNDEIITNQGSGHINSKDFLIKDGKISYEFLKDDGKVVQIYESEIQSKSETLIETLIKRQKFDPSLNFLIKYWANLFHTYYTSYRVKCITNSRLSLMPHQVNVAHRLAEEYFSRVILADEVGLGKTIEAGIYVKEMMARNLAERILIIVPASLLKQWQFEMQNKFNIHFKIYDGKKIKKLRQKGSYRHTEILHNPFYYDNLIICSLQFARNKKYIELLSNISWDIVIFDEAHHLRRYLTNSKTGSYRETLNYELAKKISLSSESLLLLTATPLQLHSFELYSLIELIKPETFGNFSDFEHFRKNRGFINLLITNLMNIDKLNNFELKSTIKLLKDMKYIDKRKSNIQITANLKNNDLKYDLVKKIETDHTLSKFLIRNRKKNVFTKDFITNRIVKTIIINPTQPELDLYSEIRLYLAKIYNSSLNNKKNVGIGFVITTLQKLLTSSKFAFLKSLERRLKEIERYKNLFLSPKAIKEENPEYYELELEEQYIDSEVNGIFRSKSKKERNDEITNLVNHEKILKEFYDKLVKLSYDSKSDKLIELLNHIYSKNPHEKVIIFTQFVDTLKFLKAIIEEQNQNYDVELFYGGLDKTQKDEAVERFRSCNQFGILLSTEIGGEGRNFQFCRIMINYDLPWNPMKLEQRIGRLDRIGQKSQEIYIYNFFMEGTVETDVIHALVKRINLFEESIGILEPIIGRIEKDFKNVLFAEDDGKKRKNLNKFYRTLDEEIRKAKEIEIQLDDLMIDKKSFQMEGLISSAASNIIVKLTHSELYLLVKNFFGLNNHFYGTLYSIGEFTEKINENSIQDKGQFKIKIHEPLLNNNRYPLLREYEGTFNLELAREKEEIDFFALGHPLIDNIIRFCISDEFPGKVSRLTLKRDLIIPYFKDTSKIGEELYLFIFSVKYQGYIIENQISAIVLDKNGNEIKDFADFFLDIKNYNKLFAPDDSIKDINLISSLIYNLHQVAQNKIKVKNKLWKEEIKTLNEKIYSQEKKKKEKIFAHNRKTLRLKVEMIKQKLERKESQEPTERKRLNIKNLTDQARKQEKIKKIEKLHEEIKFLKRDKKLNEKKLDDLSFEFEDLKNEMIRRNKSKFLTNMLSFALVNLV